MVGASLLTLPTELRLLIYELLLLPTASSYYSGRHERFSYLYRSPGRATRPGPATRGPHVQLLSICHQIKEELLDTLFRHRQFYLEASLYANGGYGGTLPMPYDAFPSIWLHAIRRLVLFTVLDYTRLRPIADLRPLQQMTSLMEVWLICSVHPQDRTDWSSPSDCHPIKALLESIPANCVLRIGYTPREQDIFVTEIGAGLNYIFQQRNDALNEDLAHFLPQWAARKGHLSGDSTDHSTCTGGVCHGRRDCVNSALPRPLNKATVRPWRSFWSR